MPTPTRAVTAPTTPETLLALPAAQALPRPLREALVAAAAVLPADAASAEPAAVVAGTLEALAMLGADAEVVAATLLHAVPAWADAAVARPGMAGVARLLDGQRAAETVWVLHAEQSRGGHEGLRRLLLAIVRDLRVVLVLLSRQLALMRAASTADDDRRRGLAQLTRDIHAPLANRLGIWQLKWELEDLAFRHLEPEAYRAIARSLDDKRSARERYIESVKRQLGDALAAQGVRAEIAGRPKHIFSIWKKMQRKDVAVDGLYDLRAVRVLVDDVAACYAALGVVHAAWAPVPGEFDDYIARPKQNDYRSLHTAVVGPEGKTLEVQIRTHEMHAQSELGVAAHWRYKERGGSSRSSGAADAALERKVEWMRRLLDAHAADDTLSDGRASDGVAAGDAGLAGALGTELVEDRVYALTPKGEVIDLPRGATPLDFAYHVHTEVGHRCRGAKVDGRIVPLDHVLRSGDRVEILTAKVGEPRRDWLLASNGFLASPRSREKVRVWFHRLDRARNVQAGREMLDRELRRLGLLSADLAPVFERFRAESLDELHVQVALGDTGPHQVGRALLELEREANAPAAMQSQASAETIALRTPRRAPKPEASAFTVVGVGNLLVQIAQCCRPLPGERIAGYLTAHRGVSVHRADCGALARLATRSPQRVLPVEWGRAGGGHEAAVELEGVDRRHLLKDVTNLVAQEDAHVLAISGDAGGGGRVRLRLRLRVQDFGQLSRLLARLEAVPGIERAHRA